MQNNAYPPQPVRNQILASKPHFVLSKHTVPQKKCKRKKDNRESSSYASTVRKLAFASKPPFVLRSKCTEIFRNGEMIYLNSIERYRKGGGTGFRQFVFVFRQRFLSGQISMNLRFFRQNRSVVGDGAKLEWWRIYWTL